MLDRGDAELRKGSAIVSQTSRSIHDLLRLTLRAQPRSTPDAEVYAQAQIC